MSLTSYLTMQVTETVGVTMLYIGFIVIFPY